MFGLARIRAAQIPGTTFRMPVKGYESIIVKCWRHRAAAPELMMICIGGKLSADQGIRATVGVSLNRRSSASERTATNDTPRATAGGQKRQRLRLPLIFKLEPSNSVCAFR